MGFGPLGQNGKYFAQMTPEERDSYFTEANRIRTAFLHPRDKDSELLPDLLVQACECSMLYYPDGKLVRLDDMKKVVEDVDKIPTFISNLTLVTANYNEQTQNVTYAYYPIEVGRTQIQAGRTHLTPEELVERRLKYVNEKQTQQLKAMGTTKREAYFKDMDDVFHDLQTENIKVGGNYLKERIETAIEGGFVHFSDGRALNKQEINTIINSPAYLKNLVFTQRPDSERYSHAEYYRLAFTDGTPMTVKMDYSRMLTPEAIVAMDNELASLDKRSDVPGLYAKALAKGSQADIDKYKHEMDEYGFAAEQVGGLPAFRVKPGSAVYFHGKDTPITSADELIKAVRGIDPPAKPNSWGVFEWVRETWHSIFHNVADYVEYENKTKAYNIDKYVLGKAAGYDMSDMDATIAAYEAKDRAKLGDNYVELNERDSWMGLFSEYKMTDTQKTLWRDLKNAMKAHPELQTQILKNIPAIDNAAFERINSAAEAYAAANAYENNKFGKDTIGDLSVLGVMANCGVFSNETKAVINSACKEANPVIQWWKSVSERPMNEETKAFFTDLKNAMENYPNIGKQIVKEYPAAMNEEAFENLAFAAQTYAYLSQSGALSTDKLGDLSVLAIASKTEGMFSKETVELIDNACKVMDPTYEASAKKDLSDEELKNLGASEPGKNVAGRAFVSTEWLESLDEYPMDEETKTFFNDLKTAMEKHPEIGEKIMKEYPPAMDKEAFERLSFAAQTYAYLGKSGALSVETLGELSVLAVASKTEDIFSKETVELIDTACKAVDPTYGIVNTGENLSDEQVKALVENEPGKVTNPADAQAAHDKIRSAMTAEEQRSVENLAKELGVDLNSVDLNEEALRNTVTGGGATEINIDEPQANSLG